MSMNATDSVRAACATLRATVDLPEPEPPAMPMMSGFIGSTATGPYVEEIDGSTEQCEDVTL